jgi:hypothetical protein
MKPPFKSALLFIAIGVALYAGLYCAAEQLMLRTAHSNAFFKIATVQNDPVDWIILGASHAMPLDFADFNDAMERETGQRILNLAAPGAGPLYNRFVLEHFLREHRARNLLYVADAFAFYSRTWNEERFADAKLLRRTPFEPAIAWRLGDYARREGVDPRAVLDYVSGFSKINNRERFQRDVWEGEAQFDRLYRPSASALGKRIAYLYPEQTPEAGLQRYLETFSSLVALARREGMRVVIVKMPVPPEYHRRLPGEAAFDDGIARLLAAPGVRFVDHSLAIAEPQFYFDTDHLNRAGLTEFFARHLKPILVSAKAG